MRKAFWILGGTLTAGTVVIAALLFMAFMSVFTMIAGTSRAAACQVQVDTSAVGEIGGRSFEPKQLQNASTIVQTATELGISEEGLVIAMMTALQESNLWMYANESVPESLSYPHDQVGSDHDSVNFFQQRTASGWGTVAELMDPVYATKAFFGGPTGPNQGSPRGLLDIPGWETMSRGEAAQTVQVSAFPDAYDKWETTAVQLVEQLTGSTVCTPGTPQQAAGDDYPWPNELTDDQGGTLSPLRYYYRECVDFVAWRLNRDAGVTKAPWKWTWANLTPEGGNAIDWIDSWRAAGWKVSHEPQTGGVAWWGTSVGAYGHVAYVQSVLPDGQVVLEEYNWGGKHTYGTRTVPASSIDYFLSPPP
ncbi:CHAP domain-containing protein [Agromyces bauzanensis]